MKTIAILGGGASGLAAAVTLARELPDTTVLLYEKNAEPGRKLLATGNGRCNLSNQDIRPSDFHGNSALISLLTESFGTEDCLAFFRSLGLSTLAEEGRIYPRTMAAATVRDVLWAEVRRLGVIVKCNTPVETLTKTETGFLINGTEAADMVLLAVGGKAGSKFGTDGEGYKLVKALGLTYQPISPALVQMKIREDISGLHGLRVRAGITLKDHNGKEQGREIGELQFAGDTLSGIAAMQLSGTAAVLAKTAWPTVHLDFCPEWTAADVLSFLQERRTAADHSADKPQETGHSLCQGFLHNKLIPVLFRFCDLSAEAPASSLSDPELTRLAEAVKDFPLTVLGTKSYKDAQVTHGGVGADQLKPDSLECKTIPGLYFAGELLNVDGLCGGYNLHFAWGTGIYAAKEIIRAQNQ